MNNYLLNIYLNIKNIFIFFYFLYLLNHIHHWALIIYMEYINIIINYLIIILFIFIIMNFCIKSTFKHL